MERKKRKKAEESKAEAKQKDKKKVLDIATVIYFIVVFAYLFINIVLIILDSDYYARVSHTHSVIICGILLVVGAVSHMLIEDQYFKPEEVTVVKLKPEVK